MVRTPCCDRSGLKKGTWTPEEDRKLKTYITRYGCWNWRQLPKYAGLSRCGKSCRLRWMNYLRPDIKRGTFTEQEEDIIIKQHQSLGNKWSAIASKLPGRTDNDIKNHWHTYLKKRMTKQKSVSYEFQSESSCEKTSEAANCAISTSQSPQSLQSSPRPSSSVSSVTADAMEATNWTNLAAEIDPLTDISTEFSESFWTQPFLADNFNPPSDFQAPLLVDQELLFPFSPILGEEFMCSYGFYDEHSNVFSF